MDAKKGKGIMLILGKHKPEDHKDDLGVDGEGDDTDAHEKSAVEDLLHALEAKDVEGVHEALKDFVQLCWERLEKEEGADDGEKDEESAY
jgi:hypothetical protein